MPAYYCSLVRICSETAAVTARTRLAHLNFIAADFYR